MYVLDLNNLTRDIRLIYKSSTSTNIATNKSGEIILAAIQPKAKPKFKKQFKGECFLCRSKGHKPDDCWDSEKNKDKHPPIIKRSPLLLLLLLVMLQRKN
jgi:hypothetical protein